MCLDASQHPQQKVIIIVCVGLNEFPFLVWTLRDAHAHICEFCTSFASSPKKEKQTEFAIAKDSFYVLNRTKITEAKYTVSTIMENYRPC